MAVAGRLRQELLPVHLDELIRSDIGDADHLLVRIKGTRPAPFTTMQLASHRAQDFLLTRANRRRTAAEPEGADQTKSYNVDRIATFHDWSSQQLAVFKRWCARLMDELYPGWRHDTGTRRVTPLDLRSPTFRGHADRAPTRRGDAPAPSPPAQDRIAGKERMLMSLRSEVAGLKLLRQEHRTLLAQFQQALARARSERRKRRMQKRAARRANAALQRAETSFKDHIAVCDRPEGAVHHQRERYRSLRQSISYRPSLTGQVVLTGGPVAVALAGGAPDDVTAVFAALALFRAPYQAALGVAPGSSLC